MVNCEFRPIPDPPDYQVVNTVPPQGIDDAPRSYELTHGKDETMPPFVDFGGLAHNAPLSARRKPRRLPMRRRSELRYSTQPWRSWVVQGEKAAT